VRDIDIITQKLLKLYPGLTISRLDVRHPGADDRGLWFFRHPTCAFEARLQTASGSCPVELTCDRGMSPALITTADHAILAVAEKLGLAHSESAGGDNEQGPYRPDFD